MSAMDVWLQGFGSGLLLCLVLFVVVWMLSRQMARRNVRKVFDEMERTERAPAPDDQGE